jgi:hypothetical protein
VADDKWPDARENPISLTSYDKAGTAGVSTTPNCSSPGAGPVVSTAILVRAGRPLEELHIHVRTKAG